MSPIYKTFYNKHIDLSKLISVGDARFVDNMGSGGYFVSFDMNFQLMDNPIVFVRKVCNFPEYRFVERDEVDPGDSGYSHELQLIDGTWTTNYHNKNLLCVKNLQDQIDVIVKVWKLYIETRF